MLLDARSLPPDHTLQADVCIIGGGPAGLTLLQELAKAGLDTCLLEAGGLQDDKIARSLTKGESVGLPYPLQESRARLFGGTSIRWHPDTLLRTRPLEPLDFEVRPWVKYSGWPFNRAHLDRFYDRALDICGIGSFTREYAEYTTRFQLDELRVVTTMFQPARRETFRDLLPDLTRMANVRLVLNANVLEIEATENSPAVERLRVGTVAGHSFFARAKVYILACGGIENARLLLLSDSRYKQGIGNQNDLVGRFFMEHPHLNSSHILPADAGAFVLPRLYAAPEAVKAGLFATLSISPEVQEAERVGNFTAVIHETGQASRSQAVRSLRQLQHIKTHGVGSAFIRGHVANVLSNPRDVAAFVLDRVVPGRRNRPRLAELQTMSEQVPNPESRVSLSSKRDQLGLRMARLNWQITGQDVQTIKVGQQVIDAELQKAGIGRLGAKYVDESPPPAMSGGHHHMGTTRMHDDPKQGVVDADGKVHSMTNLYVTGSSVFPTGGYANPTLTVVALALRLAEHVEKRFHSSK